MKDINEGSRGKQRLKKAVLNALLYGMVLFTISVILIGLEKDKDYSAAQNEKAHKIGASYMTMNNPFFEVINSSIKTTVEANGDILITRDPALDADRQLEQISELIDEGVEALFIAPVDYAKIIPVIEEAKEKGIIIIFVDTEVYDERLADGIVVSDNYLAGSECANNLMQQKNSAKIVLFEHNRAKSANDRVNGFVDTIEQNPNYTIVKRVDAKGQLEVAMPLMKKILQEESVEFDTVFAINDVSALGAMAALEDANMLDEVSVLGVDGAPEAKALIREDLMMATAAQYPSKIGENAVNQLYSIFRGENYEKKVLVPVDLVTKYNVDKFGITNWQ